MARETPVRRFDDEWGWPHGPGHLEGDVIVIRAADIRVRRLPQRDEGVWKALATVSDPEGVRQLMERFGPGPAHDELHDLRIPVQPYLEAARELKQCVEIYQHLQAARLQKKPGAVDALRALALPLFGLPREKRPKALWLDDQLTIDNAAIHLSEVVSERLRGAEFLLNASSTEPGIFEFTLRATDLITLAFADLARDLADRQDARLCDYCGKVFVAEGRPRRYCKPACASNARYRAWLARHQKAASRGKRPLKRPLKRGNRS